MGDRLGTLGTVSELSFFCVKSRLNFRKSRSYFRVLPGANLRLRSYHVESTGSRSITEVKQRRAQSVLGWVTAWEHWVP